MTSTSACRTPCFPVLATTFHSCLLDGRLRSRNIIEDHTSSLVETYSQSRQRRQCYSLFILKTLIGVCLKRGRSINIYRALFGNPKYYSSDSEGHSMDRKVIPWRESPRARAFPPKKWVQGSHKWGRPPWISPSIHGSPDSMDCVQHIQPSGNHRDLIASTGHNW